MGLPSGLIIAFKEEDAPPPGDYILKSLSNSSASFLLKRQFFNTRVKWKVADSKHSGFKWSDEGPKCQCGECEKWCVLRLLFVRPKPKIPCSCFVDGHFVSAPTDD